MKIIIQNLEPRGAKYFISKKDNDDFDWIMSNIFFNDLDKFFDEEGEPVGEMIDVSNSVQPNTWNPNFFIEWFNRSNKYDYRATLEY